MTDQLPPRFAFYRKNTDVFEIFKQKGPKIVFEDPLGVPLWHVVKQPHLTVETRESTLGNHTLAWTYVGAALYTMTAGNSTYTIPIVQFSKNIYLPHSIRGVRVLYRDGLKSAYFGKKHVDSAQKPKATAEPGPGPGPGPGPSPTLEIQPIRKRKIMRPKAEPLSSTPSTVKERVNRFAKSYSIPNRVIEVASKKPRSRLFSPRPTIGNGYEDDEEPLISECKGLTCLATLVIFSLTCFYAHYVNNTMNGSVYNFQNFEEDLYWP